MGIKIDIKTEIEELKRNIQKYELESFIGFFSHFIRVSSSSLDDNSSLNQFESKLKDFQYLIALKLSNNECGDELFSPNDSLLSSIAQRINRIKDAYSINQIDFDTFGDNLEYSHKFLIHSFTFNSYYHNGDLTYLEQNIERFKSTFELFDDKVSSLTGIKVNTLVNIYIYIESLAFTKKKRKFEFTNSDEYIEFLKINGEESKLQQFLNKLDDKTFDQFERFISCPYDYLKFTSKELEQEFSAESVRIFLELFTADSFNFLGYNYYTDINPLDLRPIIKISKNEYLLIYQKQLPIAYYNYFWDLLKNEFGVEKLQKQRSLVLEDKCYKVFCDFFKKNDDAIIFRNYFVDKTAEQDLLILTKGSLFIVECKAAKHREPFRDIEKAFNRIKDDFKETVKLGYIQCLRVENWCASNKELPLFNKKRELLHTIELKKVHSVYSIIVTQERLGPIQEDLGLLLDIEEDKEYPWSVCITDLEVFLGALKLKTKNPRNELCQYIKNRELLNERMFCSDELDICATFIDNKPLFLKVAKDLNSTVSLMGTNQDFFDDIYHQGLGLLKEELWIEEKRKSGYQKDNERITATVYRNT